MSSASALSTRPLSPYPGESRRILAALETSAVKVEEMVYAPGLSIARHSHETANLLYIIAGVHWSGYSRGGDTCAPRTVRFLPAGEPHENYFPIESRCLHVELRQPIWDLAAEYGPTIGAPGELTQPSSAGLGAQLLHEFRQRDEDSRLDIEGVILRLLLIDRQDSTRRRQRIPPWLLRIREMLREDPTSRPTLLDLARCVGRHPVQISRQFHQHFGCTISEYLRRVRVARAQSLLACPDLDVSEIALACGFCDQSHFTSTFRRLTGTPPYRYRLLTIGGRSVTKLQQVSTIGRHPRTGSRR
jgi:AraC family transcriptional regulator